MISLEKVGNAIKFTFNGNDHYLQDGTIEVPLNSLMLVTDESDMFTLKKSATNDIFVSGLYSEIGMSKSQLESWFKENAVGGAGGTDEEKVQEMIDASISGKADVSALNVYADAVKYNPTTKYVEFYHGGTGGTKVFQFDASAFVIDGMVQNVEIKDVTISGEVVTCLVISFNTDAGKQDISIPISEIFDANNYYNKAEIDVKERVTSTALNDLEERKLDASAYTPTDLSDYYNKTETNTLLGGKQDTLVSGTNIKTINNESILGSGNITIESGKAISGGTNISITTGETADTINCTLPISADNNTDRPKLNLTSNYSLINGNNSITANNAGTAKDNLVFGNTNTITNSGGNGGGIDKNIVFGDQNQINATNFLRPTASYNMFIGVRNTATNASHNFAKGSYNSFAKDNQFAVGDYHSPKNGYEANFGQYSLSNYINNTFGNSGNTLFSVGNGTSNSARHNAFEIRQNGDIYITLNGQDVKLQDKLGGTVDTEITSASTNPVTSSAIYNQLGGLKFIKLTQTEYDALSTKDGNTMYIIVPAPPVPKVTAKYNITDTTNPTLILYYDTFGITSMIVDGGTSESVTGDSYQFSTTGEHTVEFILSGSTVTYNMFGNGFSDIPLTSVAFSDAITSMGSVFPGCENLTNIDWGNGVTSLTMEGNFKSCRGLTSIVFPEQLVNFSAGDEVYDTYTDSSITSVTFSNRLTTFNTSWAMRPGSGNFDVHLGSNITKVIFDTDGNSLPENFYIEATTPPITELSEGMSISSGFDLYVPASAVSAYQADVNWSNYAYSIQAIPTT